MDNPENLVILKILVQTDADAVRSAILYLSIFFIFCTLFTSYCARVPLLHMCAYRTSEHTSITTSTAPAPLRKPLIWLILKIW